MTSTTPSPYATFFDMSKMEKNTSSLLDASDPDNSSWGELCLEGEEKDQFTLSTLANSSTRNHKSSSLLGDDSSWGELDLDDINTLEEPKFTRRATFAGRPSGGSSLLDDISCPTMLCTNSSSPRRKESDNDNDVNELTHCLKSMYGDYSKPSSSSKSSSSSTKKTKKTSKSRRKSQSLSLAPALKRFTTA